ncbi:MAG TPA: Cof-type HAD-IIB family hydrolase [Lapillicoccus sp.]|nr:Cof-type HAD-IIB family hydrolase [Lapillicoccus sp.]
MRRPRLVASDLDGTLLRSDGTGSERTAAALKAVQAEGIRTVLVTARPPRWLDGLAHLVGDGGVAICGNGAFVYDVPSRTVLSHKGIEPTAFAEIVADLRRELPGVTFAAERATGFALEEAYESQHPVPVDALRGPIDTSGDGVIGKLLGRHPVMSDDEFRERVADVVGERGIVAYSGAGGLAEISAPGVTKAAGLESWCAELGIGAADVWAFGDMPNDLPMIVWAGTSFAVANAHPDVIAAADHVCPSNDEDGVAQVLEGLVSM